MKSYTFFKKFNQHIDKLNENQLKEIENLDFLDYFDLTLRGSIVLSVMNCGDYFKVNILDCYGLKNHDLISVECSDVSEINPILAKFWKNHQGQGGLISYTDAVEIDRIRHLKYKKEYFLYNPVSFYSKHRNLVTV